MTDTLAAAQWLAARDMCVFELDHPELDTCAGVRTPEHDPDTCTERGKHPACKWSRVATTDTKQIIATFVGNPRNIGVACGPSKLLVIDEDVPDDFARFSKSVGQTVPDTFRVKTGKGWHYYFRQPEGLELGNAEGALRDYGVNVRGRGGYVVGPGSTHANGTEYLPDDADAEIVPCPDWLVAALTGEIKPTDGHTRPGQPKDHTWWRDTEIIHHPNRHAALVAAAGYCRKLGMSRDGAVPTIRDVLGRCCPGTCCRDDQGKPTRSYTLDQALAKLDDIYSRYEPGQPLVTPATVQDSDAEPETRNRLLLPTEFWDHGGPLLQYIREVAWSAGRCPDVVLHVCLARIAAMAPHGITCNTGIAPASPNWFVNVIGGTSAGKSTGIRTGKALIPVPHSVELRDWPLGSGQGLAEAYMGEVPDPDDSRGKRKIRQQVRHNVYAHCDEGAQLTGLAEQTGSIIYSTLRTAWTGDAFGQGNATAERYRDIGENNYSLGIVIGYQPHTIAPLLRPHEIDVGTPQRFAYVWGLDNTRPRQRPDHPGLLQWTPPATVPPGGYQMPPEIKAEIVAEDDARTLDGKEVHPLDGHQPLWTAKAATLLMLLHERTTITTHDWYLAQMMWDTSCRVRDHLVARAQAEERKREQAGHDRNARRELTVEAKLYMEAKDKAKSSAIRKVVQHHKKQEHDEPGCPARCINQAISGRDKKQLNISADVVDELLAEQKIRRITGGQYERYEPGKRAEA